MNTQHDASKRTTGSRFRPTNLLCLSGSVRSYGAKLRQKTKLDGMMDVWWHALKAIAMHRPAAVFEMVNGARFWWMPTVEQVRSDRLSDAFSYDDLRSLMLFEFVNFGSKQWQCDLDSLAVALNGIPKLQIRVVQDVIFQPAAPRNRALVLELQQAFP